MENRLRVHLSGLSRYTSIAKDWQLVYAENYPARTEAIQREKAIKAKKSRRYIEFLIAGYKKD